MSWPASAGAIDTETNTLTVARKLSEVNGTLSFGPPKTAAGRRTVGIPSFVARSLAAHLDLYAEHGEEGLVFPAVEGGPMRRSNFRRRIWEPATAEVGVSGLRFHDLRHTAATLAAAGGASLRSLMARIGHASVVAALRFQHVLDGRDAEIVDYLERFGEEPSTTVSAQDDRSVADPKGHVVGTEPDPGDPAEAGRPPEPLQTLGCRSGADGNRTARS